MKYDSSILKMYCESNGYELLTEHRFHPIRKWRFDFAVITSSAKIAIEIDGGLWMVRSRHAGGAGQIKDNEKFNTAATMGWLVLRFTPKQFKDNLPLWFISEIMKNT